MRKRMHRVFAEGSGIQTELGLECVVEVGYVAEAGVKSDVQHLRGFQYQTCGGATQAQPAKITMRRETSELLEDTKEVVTTEPGFASKRTEFVVQLRTGFHEANDASDPCFCSQRTVRF